MSSVDIVYAANMKPGDVFAGIVVPDAPTMPVQTWAAAHTLSGIAKYTGEDGQRMMRLQASGLDLTPIPAATQCLLIRR